MSVGRLAYLNPSQGRAMEKRKKRNTRRRQRVLGRELDKARKSAASLRVERDGLLKAAEAWLAVSEGGQ